jgi:hypothetical protein
MTLKTTALVLMIAFLAVSMAAQTAPEPGPAVVAGGPGFPPPHAAGMFAMHFDAMDATPVKGAPFCANITTEHTQNFADGNRIHTTDNSTLCRDSEGRTRREAGLNLLSAGAQKPATKMVTIFDPVAGVHYLLDPENKIARRMPMPPPPGDVTAGAIATAKAGDLPGSGEHVMVFQTADGPGPDVFYNRVIVKKPGDSSGDEPAPSSENLGDQMINGIHATGTRLTTTIPAGKMGNEQPMTVISERWYSQELKATVMTKHTDPWAGELKTEFTSVNTAEPDPSLFTVPSDYTIVDDRPGPLQIRLLPPAPPKQ